MKITFFGAAGEVGRSCIMVSSGSTNILLDAGVKLGSDDQYPKIEDEKLKEIDGIVISHAHLDHCGYLPHIYSAGYRNKTYVTKPTSELANVLINDYMHISNPSNVTKEGLQQLGKNYSLHEYKKEFKIKDFMITFIPAGHILGSALIKVSDGKETLIYTGDINLTKTRLLDGADLKGLKADILITESTYGGKDDLFGDEKETAKDMVNSTVETIKAGGKVVVPSFAVGRAQEVLFLLDDYMNSGVIPKVPIYMDGMISKAMRIHRHNVIYCRKELQRRILMSDADPFKSENFIPVEKKSTRTRIATNDESSIIVTTSGMLSGGPIMYYLTKMSGNSLNKMILVGYQAEGTMGRAMQEGAREITINDSKIRVEMAVETYHMSAHADRKQLESIPGKIADLKRIFIVHGERGKSEYLKSRLEELPKKYEVTVPNLGDSFEV
ncbi:MAG: MBL fold metallo-hydrolase [Methanothrix sp.]